jgi:HK97 family phage major capsid protein
MDPELFKQLDETIKSAVDSVMEQHLKAAVGPMVASETKAIVEKMRLEKALYGKDVSGLSDDQKVVFAKTVKAVAFGKTKSDEAIISEQDERGGYLISTEVANAILRIAYSVGLVISQATPWPMGTDEKDIPAYSGAALEGEFLGVDAAGSATGITFDQVRLVVKKWQLAFAIGNDVLADANVDLANWLLALGAEALANRVDKEALVGTGKPFVGVMNHPKVATYTLAATKTGFDKFDPIADAANVEAQIEESVLDGSCYVMHRTVWAKIRAAKDTAGNFILPFAGVMQSPAMAAFSGQIGGRKPVGELNGYPVFTCRHMPAFSASAVSTPFMIFGNLKAIAFGDKGEMTVDEYRSGSFGGKEIALADQRALVYRRRFATTVGLPGAFVIVKTAAS